MSNNIHCPDAKLVKADPISSIYFYEKRDASLVALVGEGHKFSLRDKDKEVGSIVPGSGWSGSIWVAKNCVGEYEFINNHYSVTPYKNGNKKASEQVHPLDYLLRFL